MCPFSEIVSFYVLPSNRSQPPDLIKTPHEEKPGGVSGSDVRLNTNANYRQAGAQNRNAEGD